MEVCFQAVCLSMLPIDTRSRPGDNAGGGKDGDRTSFGKGNRKPVPEEGEYLSPGGGNRVHCNVSFNK